MNNLIKIDNGQAVTSSRQIAENFGKRHDAVLRAIRNLDCSAEFTRHNFVCSGYKDSSGKENVEYFMNRDGFSFLAMGFTGSEAAQWKEKYIRAFNEMEKQLSNQAIPKSLPEALRAYANEVESHEKTKLQLIEAKPKMLFADSVATSSTSILIGELAKILKQNGVEIGQNRLFEWMRQNGYLINRKGTDYNMPTQRSMELGLFKIKETTVNHSDGHITVSKTPKVTGKGQIYFVNKFLEESRTMQLTN